MKKVEFKNKTMFPKRRLDENYLYSYLLKSIEKYPGRSHTSDPKNAVLGLQGVYRALQDGLSFIKEGGKIPTSKGVAELFSKQGYILREQITFEHKTPLATYKRELHKHFYSNPKLFFELLREKTDSILVTKEEDARLRAKGLTSSLPTDGSDRYDVAGITVSDIKLDLEDIKYLK